MTSLTHFRKRRPKIPKEKKNQEEIRVTPFFLVPYELFAKRLQARYEKVQI
jgi:hypothetical protein